MTNVLRYRYHARYHSNNTRVTIPRSARKRPGNTVDPRAVGSPFRGDLAFRGGKKMGQPVGEDPHGSGGWAILLVGGRGAAEDGWGGLNWWSKVARKGIGQNVTGMEGHVF